MYSSPHRGRAAVWSVRSIRTRLHQNHAPPTVTSLIDPSVSITILKVEIKCLNCHFSELGSEKTEKDSHCKIWGAAAGHPAHDRLHIEVTESVSDTRNSLIGSGLKRRINLQTKSKAVHQRCKGLNLQQCTWRILNSVHMSDSRHTEPDLQWCMDPKLFYKTQSNPLVLSNCCDSSFMNVNIVWVLYSSIRKPFVSVVDGVIDLFSHFIDQTNNQISI